MTSSTEVWVYPRSEISSAAESRIWTLRSLTVGMIGLYGPTVKHKIGPIGLSRLAGGPASYNSILPKGLYERLRRREECRWPPMQARSQTDRSKCLLAGIAIQRSPS